MIYEWQPILGCSEIGPGCVNCVAMRMGAGKIADVEGLTRDTPSGRVWTGEIRFDEAALLEPLHLTGPRGISVCSFGDLFHEGAPDAWLDRVHAVILASRGRGHRFFATTKRARRMHTYYAAGEEALCRRWVEATPVDVTVVVPRPWPLLNLHIGVSVEDQEHTDADVPLLEALPVGGRHVVFFPLLGHVTLAPYLSFVDSVAVGEDPERPLDGAWTRALAAECRAARVPITIGGF